jgi:chaperonin GroEL (HSP60 family)
MAKTTASNEDARRGLDRGTSAIAGTVKVSLGPHGRPDHETQEHPR